MSPHPPHPITCGGSATNRGCHRVGGESQVYPGRQRQQQNRRTAKSCPDPEAEPTRALLRGGPSPASVGCVWPRPHPGGGSHGHSSLDTAEGIPGLGQGRVCGVPGFSLAASRPLGRTASHAVLAPLASASPAPLASGPSSSWGFETGSARAAPGAGLRERRPQADSDGARGEGLRWEERGRGWEGPGQRWGWALGRAAGHRKAPAPPGTAAWGRLVTAEAEQRPGSQGSGRVRGSDPEAEGCVQV